MKKINNFESAHNRVCHEGKPVWICIPAEAAKTIPIGGFAKLVSNGLMGIPTKEEEAYFETNDKE